jgi:hypothetical protein
LVVIANDDGRKMVEREEAELFVAEYSRITGVELALVGAGERPDFVCEKWGRHFGLELVRAMQDPVQRHDEFLLGGDGHLHGLDAALLVQAAVHVKEQKRASAGWRYPNSTILVIQLIGSDGEEMIEYLGGQLMDELARTGFREIWIADYSTMEPYGEIQLIGVRPKRWRGLHRHGLYGTKPYG